MANDSAGLVHSFLHKHRRILLGAAAASALSYGAYKAYNSETARTIRKLQAALANYSDAIADASSATSLLVADLNKYLNSEDEEIPRSLKQVCRLMQSTDIQTSLSDTVSTVVRSITAVSNAAATSDEPSFTDKLLEAVFSPRGHSLLGMAIGVASKNVTGTFCEYMERMQNSSTSAELSPTAVLGLLASEQGEKVLSVLITTSIKTAVFSYVDAYHGYNMYDDMVASITKQSHREAVTEIMTRITSAFCHEVATHIRKSKAAPANSSMRRSFSGADAVIVCGPERPESAASAGAGGAESGMVSKTKHCARVNSSASAGSRMSFESVAEPGVPLKLNQRLPAAPPSVWIADVVSLLKERDVRALAVDVVSSATREATRGTIETLLGGVRSSKQDAAVTTNSMAMYRLYAVMSMSIALMMYAMSPRTMMAL